LSIGIEQPRRLSRFHRPFHIDPQTGKPYGAAFPVVTVDDWVESQARLADQLGIKQFAAVNRRQPGGMQAMHWALAYPERVRHVLAIATAPHLTAQNIGVNDVARNAILTDPDFHNGDFYQHGVVPTRGLRLARMLGHNHLSFRRCDGGPSSGASGARASLIQLRHRVSDRILSALPGRQHFAAYFDANTYLLMTKALIISTRHDPSTAI